MATVTMYSCSNEKYKRIASKDSKVGVGKKSTSITQQTKKKNSLNTFLSTSTKLKSSGNYEWIYCTVSVLALLHFLFVILSIFTIRSNISVIVFKY